MNQGNKGAVIHRVKFGETDSLHRYEFTENLGVQTEAIVKNAQVALREILNAALAKLPKP